jgi:hypothetical protein
MWSVPEPATTPAERLRIALDLHDAGVEVMRQNLRRRHPGAGEQEIERLLLAWLHERPGAEHGDAVGRPRPGGLGPA